jgi:hypothetical protein
LRDLKLKQLIKGLHLSPSLHKSGVEHYRAYDKFNRSIVIINDIEKKRFESVIELLVKALTNDNHSYFEGQDETGEYIDYLERRYDSEGR